MLTVPAIALHFQLPPSTPQHSFESMALSEKAQAWPAHSESRWHHRPTHLFMPETFYIVTAGTLNKQHFFRGDERLALLQSAMFAALEAYHWQPQAWAIFSNHYHFIAKSPEEAETLSPMLNRLHSQTARELNKLDQKRGRKVWFQFWDHCLTFEKSYYARLNYVNHNAVHHGLVPKADLYPWCSAGWFAQQAEPSFRRKVESFGFDRLQIEDDF